MNTLSNHIQKIQNMNKSVLYFMTIGFALTFQNCTGQDDIITPPIESEKYEPCCGVSSDVFRELAPDVKLFIPNAFTPNGDGINDYFYPHCDTTKIPNWSIIQFSIYDSDNPQVRQILQSIPGGLNYNDIPNYAFSGKYYNKTNLKWEIWRGQIWYEIIVSVEGKGVWKLEGSACSIVCDEEAAIFRDKEGCFFPVQADSKGNYISTIPPGEDDCFGK
jgi:hypothetical protein